MTFSEQVKETARSLPAMMKFNIISSKKMHEMHLFNLYQHKFSEVASAFIQKYQDENHMFTRTTIAHVSMIDANKFQIVRRMENCLTSTPLYERIIIDRSQKMLSGFTFENIQDNQYQETYMYQEDPSNASQTIYNSYLYKSPGFRKLIRQKAHNWGVQQMENIIEAEKRFSEKLALQKYKDQATEKIREVKDEVRVKREEVRMKGEEFRHRIREHRGFRRCDCFKEKDD